MKVVYLVLIVCCVSCGNPKTEQSCETFRELQDSSLVDPAWEDLSSELYMSVGSIDLRYAKNKVPAIEPLRLWKGAGWKGERLSAQFLLWTKEELKQVSCSFTDLQSGSNLIPSEMVQARFVRYVMTDVFGNGCGKRSPEDYPATLAADMLDHLSCMDVEAKTVRPVWVTLDIPHTAQAGIYTGSLSVSVKGKKVQDFSLEVEVLDRVLPPASEWKFHLDLWQHPTAVARWHDVPVWSEEHYAYLRPLMRMLADAGQKVITTNLNKDPWNGQCYDRYADMIKWTKKADGTWSYDYTEFDRWVSFMMELGINKMINCYSMVPWNNELDYLDEASAATVTVQAVPGTDVFTEMWTPFLLDFTTHLKEKGWLEITNIAMDERSPETMKATLSLLQRITPELGVSLADNHKSYKEYPYIKDLCVSFGATVDKEDLEYRKKMGLNTTYYVCCSHPFPNQFTFSPPAESVCSAWYAAAVGLDGFLRWAYNSWVENPLTDSRFRTWPAGDTYIVYPEARSSIRFERLREGIQDVEKIRILSQSFAASDGVEGQEKEAMLKEILAGFVAQDSLIDTNCADKINDAKKKINELSR